MLHAKKTFHEFTQQKNVIQINAIKKGNSRISENPSGSLGEVLSFDTKKG